MKLFRQEGLVPRLCRESGRWQVTGVEGDVHDVCNTGPKAIRFIRVRYREDTHWMKFTSEFPVRFPFTSTPAGVFARLLMRNTGLRYAHWSMDLWGSCEGMPYMTTQWPLSIMTASVFDATCSEIDGEIRAFHQELRDKFQGGMGQAGRSAGYQAGDDGIRFLGPVSDRSLPQGGRPMLPER